MNPGLPGTGIGGLFYILSALWMPACEIWRRCRGNAAGGWPLVARQFAIAVGVAAAMSGVFWALDSAFTLHEAAQHAAGKAHAAQSFHLSALLTTMGVLVALLGAVHLVRFFLWLRRVQPAGR
jgi:hypothetical protein